MAAGTQNVTTMAAYIDELWSNEVIDAYEDNIVLSNLVDLSYKELARAGHGDIINVPNFTALTVGTITEGSNVTQTQQTNEGTTTITVATWEGARVTIPSLVDIQSMPSMRRMQTEHLGSAMALAIDDDVAALVASISQTVGTLNVDLTDDNILRAEQYLMDANVPSNDWFIALSPAQLQGFRKIDRYANSLYKASAGTMPAGERPNGYVGPLYNCEVYRSTNMVSNTSGHDNAMFQRKWAALVVQKGPVLEQWRNVAAAMDELVIWAIWGVKEMRATSGIWLKGL